MVIALRVLKTILLTLYIGTRLRHMTRVEAAYQTSPTLGLENPGTCFAFVFLRVLRPKLGSKVDKASGRVQNPGTGLASVFCLILDPKHGGKVGFGFCRK